MARIEQRIANLSLEQRALLEQRSMGGPDFSGGDSGIPRREGEGPSPLSFAQQRLWFLDQLEPGSSLYNIPRAIRISGSLNLAALEQSLSEIQGRHQSLRTTFVPADGPASRPRSMPGPGCPTRLRCARSRRGGRARPIAMPSAGDCSPTQTRGGVRGSWRRTNSGHRQVGSP